MPRATPTSEEAAEILAELERRGVFVAADGDSLFLRPKRALDDTLLARVRELKPVILEALRNRPAASTPEPVDLAPCGSPHCAGCYGVGGGRKVHPPKSSEKWLVWLERWKPKGKPQ